MIRQLHDDAATSTHLTRRKFGTLVSGMTFSAALPVHGLAQGGIQTGSAVRRAATALLAGVRSEARAKLGFSFVAPERHRWRYVPGIRPGLMLEEMARSEQDLAHALMAVALSPVGYAKATGVMKLANVLQESRDYGRGSGAYAFAIFGDPSAGGAWGWRVEGHHLSLNFTLLDDRVISATPHCVCADPMEVTKGGFARLKPLDRDEYMGRDLARNLDERQVAHARMAGPVPRNVRAGPGQAEIFGRSKGIAFRALNDETQRHLILGLAETYVSNLPRDLADAEMAKLSGPARDDLRFQWSGGFETSDLHYYRLHGPSLLIEYSTRERPTHVHTLWREPGNDFGRAQLAAADHPVLPPASA